MSRRVRSRSMPDHGSIDFEALANELRRSVTNESCFDLYGESEGVGRDGARVQEPPGAEPGGARPSPDLRAVEADCS